MHIYIYIYTYMHAYIHVYTCVYIYIYIHIYSTLYTIQLSTLPISSRRAIGTPDSWDADFAAGHAPKHSFGQGHKTRTTKTCNN